MNEIDTGRLSGLSVSDRGFAFDSHSGESFTVSPSGRDVIRSLVAGCDPERIAGDLAARIAVDAATVRRDLRDFLEQLRVLRLVEGVR